MADKEHKVAVDYRAVCQAILKYRKLYFKILPIVFILSCIWILPQPRFYTSEVMLAPETTGEVDGSSLSDLASSFGFNLGIGGANDAIYPMLYPDLFDSSDFLVSLFSIEFDVVDDDETYHTDYYTYLAKHQKVNLLTKPFRAIVRSLKQVVSPKKASDMPVGDANKLNPFMLSRDDYNLVKLAAENIQCSVDKKTDVTTITVTDQNRVVCAILADSVKARLQNFITSYRTSKARQDLEYYQELADNAKKEYDDALTTYSQYVDQHRDVLLQSSISKRDDLENTMSLKYNTYTAMVAQLEAAKAKVQERTPAFTTLKSASVPIKPTGPKRMFFVATMLVLAFIGITIYVLKDILRPEEEGTANG